MLEEFQNKIKTTYLPLLIQEPESLILVAGIIGVCIYVLLLAGSCIVFPRNSQYIIGMTATHLLFGRAAAMSFGYTVSLSHFSVISINMVIETLLVCIIYPVFVFSLRKLLVIKSLGRFFDKIDEMAVTNHDKVKKYGTLGLFIFVFFPFWMTGPVIGSVIGHFMGFRPLRNMLVVLSGTFFAIILWAITLRGIHEKIASFNPYAPIFVLALIIILAVFGHVLLKNSIRKDPKK